MGIAIAVQSGPVTRKLEYPPAKWGSHISNQTRDRKKKESEASIAKKDKQDGTTLTNYRPFTSQFNQLYFRPETGSSGASWRRLISSA